MFGFLLLWAAFPPLELWPLAWLAPVPWVLLIMRPALSGRRPYRMLWLAAFVFNLALYYWVTLPHWATSFGWLVLCFYFALYFPLFIAISRAAVHSLRLSPIVAAPVVWTGLEFARSHLLTGFNMGALAHTQYRVPLVIQVSDLAGSYLVSFLIVLAGTCVGRMLFAENRRFTWWPLAPLTAALVAVAAYGDWRLDQQTTSPGPTVALVQGSIDIDMKHDPAEAAAILQQYYGLTRDSVERHGQFDLVVWPETMFRDAWRVFAPDYVPPAGVTWTVEQGQDVSRRNISELVAPLNSPFLIGIDTWYYKPGGVDAYNSALLTDRGGMVVGRYDKVHLVPFGEYVWFADWFPWLYQLTPLHGGSKHGAGPVCMESEGVRYAPNICYENTLPHFIRRQVADVLVNLTNDGWFWGSAELDMHLACAVFRAVECRKPFLIAANTGFSASIDSDGRILQQGPRRDTAVLVDQVRLDSRRSPYLVLGDWPAGGCLLLTVGFAFAGWRKYRAGRQLAA
jgi:apolipoprotein N-acyltransferase